MTHRYSHRTDDSDLSLRRRISDFFFAKEVPFGLAILRILISIACLMVTVPRWIYTRELYSSDGAPAPLSVNYGYGDLLPIPSGGVAVALMTILTFCCATACIGWRTRTSMIISAVLYTYLSLLDCTSTMTKYSVITSHVLFLLSFSQCGAVWSADAWLKRRRQNLPAPRTLADYPVFEAWPRRLIQILIGVVYFGAAVTKLHTPAYFSGDQLIHWAMTNVNNANPFGEWLTLFPAFLVVCAYLCVVWEILFLFLSWRGWGRISMLLIGVGFHVMTTLTLGLYLFPITCISIYFTFANSADIVAFAARWRRWQRAAKSGWRRIVTAVALAPAALLRPIGARLAQAAPRLTPAMSSALFGVGLVTVAVGAVEIEYRLDPYGERRPEGPYELQEIPAEDVRRMLTANTRIRDYDKFLSMDVGTEMLAGMVLGRKAVFHHGENILVQCTLSPPHEDMWVECNLHDGNDVMLDRVGQVIVRSQLRGNFLYRACQALEPGTYYLVLKTGGHEITRHKIEIVAGICSEKNCPIAK